MSVEKLNPQEIFPDFNFDVFEKFIKEDILSKEPKTKLAEEDRGSKSANIYEDCKSHNLAVNAKFTSIRQRGNMAIHINNLKSSLMECYKDCGNEVRNCIMYRKDDYMGWHTNKYQFGQRIYLIWAEEDKKSSFDYYEKGEKKSILAPKGFSVNSFYCGDFERMLTHQVTSDCNRISIGFRLR